MHGYLSVRFGSEPGQRRLDASYLHLLVNGRRRHFDSCFVLVETTIVCAPGVAFTPRLTWSSSVHRIKFTTIERIKCRSIIIDSSFVRSLSRVPCSRSNGDMVTARRYMILFSVSTRERENDGCQLHLDLVRLFLTSASLYFRKK